MVFIRLKNIFLLSFFICSVMFGKSNFQIFPDGVLEQQRTITSLKSFSLLFPEHIFDDLVPKTNIITFNELNDLFVIHNEIVRNELSNSDVWINNRADYEFCYPFVQKLIIPVGSEVILFGDVHGSWHSLIRSLERLRDAGFIDDDFNIVKPNCYLIFLGDYSDRGAYGVEVLYAILRLKIANPRSVVLLRGNHENSFINMRYGFFNELCRKFEEHQAKKLMNQAVRTYNHMPVALYLGSGQGDHIDYVLCCHGGPEIGFSPRSLLEASHSRQFFLIDKLERSLRVEMLPEYLKKMVKIMVPKSERKDVILDCQSNFSTLGFLWHDMIVDNGQSPVAYTNGRGWAYGKSLVQFILRNDSGDGYSINAIFRGHQHNNVYGDMLDCLINGKGMWMLWDGLVYTLFSAPVVIPQICYDSLLFIKTAQHYKDWSIKHSVSSLM